MNKLHRLDKHPDIQREFLSSQHADNRIIISRFEHSISFFYKNTRLFNTNNALLLFEKNYSPILYVPKPDTFERHFLASTKTSYCPFKGEASYWSLNVNGEILVDAVWEYSNPKKDVEAIKSHLAFANHQSGGEFLVY